VPEAATLLQVVSVGVVLGAKYAVLGASFALVYRTCKVFHVAHGALYVFAGHCFLQAVRAEIPVAVALVLAMAASAAVGALMETAVYGPLGRRNASVGVTVVASLGLYLVLENALVLAWGNQQELVGQHASTSWTFGPIAVSEAQLWMFTAALAAWLVVSCGLRSRYGTALRAVADDPLLAAAWGVDAYAVRRWAMVCASALAAMTASLSVLDVGLDPHAGFEVMLIAAVATILGNSITGAFAGGLALGLAQELASVLFSARWDYTVAFAALFVGMWLRKWRQQRSEAAL